MKRRAVQRPGSWRLYSPDILLSLVVENLESVHDRQFSVEIYPLQRGNCMHYIIGLITALAGLLWALNSLQRSGFKLSSINPFAWHRRSQWSQKYGADPVTRVQDPLELVAVLLMGMAKMGRSTVNSMLSSANSLR